MKTQIHRIVLLVVFTISTSLLASAQESQQNGEFPSSYFMHDISNYSAFYVRHRDVLKKSIDNQFHFYSFGINQEFDVESAHPVKPSFFRAFLNLFRHEQKPETIQRESILAEPEYSGDGLYKENAY